MPLPAGLYDLLLTNATLPVLPRDLQADLQDLDAERAAERLAEHLAREARRILAASKGAESERLHAQLTLVNCALTELRRLANEEREGESGVVSPPQILRALYPPAAAAPHWPETGLSSPYLFTSGKGSPTLLTELRREAASCERIDILVSFIRTAGVRKLIDVLKLVTAADARGEGRTRIRVLTTTYMGATQIEALDQLAELNGCEVRISLDGRRTRLHAKAWIFHRSNGFGSAYVGSANLSGAALMGGLEWTVKLTERGQEAQFSRAGANFETLWEDGEFTTYEPRNPASRTAVAAALQRETRSGEAGPTGFFDIQPKPFQQEMLDDLRRERAEGRTRNLLVAATGTGKTVVAALDYRSISDELGGQRPRLLFVAHRTQILRQALRVYREVLQDHSFGEVLSGGVTPVSHDHLFATIDTVASRQLVERFGDAYWHTVVIDECHRLGANRFRQLAEAIQPRFLLGLTATPERSDGFPIQEYFNPRPDRSPTVELRLWHALDLQLVAPFEYFAVDDETDFSEVPWETVSERNAIERQVVGNVPRARKIIQEWRRLAGNPRESRALVFCVSIRHAEFMAAQLNAAGLPAMVVTGETPKAEQLRAPHRLARGSICAIVTVDLYNEGVDIPEVDTLLFLRPTQSPVLFQQQLGRGLRLFRGKEGCLVLDFVGVHRADFRFDRLFSAITGKSRRQLIESVEHGFTDLAPGCHIHLQPRTREQVLRGLRSIHQHGWQRLSTELQSYTALRGTRNVALAEFVHDQNVELGEIYRATGRSGWTTLRADAGLTPSASEEGAALSSRMGQLLHADDPHYLAAMQALAEGRLPDGDVRAEMITYQMFGSRGQAGPPLLREQLARSPECAKELHELAELLGSRSRAERHPLPGAEDVPLTLHASYEVREILTAFRWLSPGQYAPLMAGVLPLGKRQTELLFVTLDKSAGFHDHLAFHDYAISRTRFHWQTQNSAGQNTPSGRRYIESATNGWRFQLFVRERREAPYRACGEVYLNSKEDVSGDRPMNIVWTLKHPLPPKLFADFSVLRG